MTCITLKTQLSVGLHDNVLSGLLVLQRRQFMMQILFVLILWTFPVSGFGETEVNGCCESQEECDAWMQTWTFPNNFTLRLHPHKYTCSSKQALFAINLNSAHPSHNTTDAFNFNGFNEDEWPTNITLFSDGTLQVSNEHYFKTKIDRKSYCIKKVTGLIVEAQVCLSDVPYYRKCCPLNQAYDPDKGCVSLVPQQYSKFPPRDLQDGNELGVYPSVEYIECDQDSRPNSYSTSLENYPKIPWKVVNLNRVAYYDHATGWKQVPNMEHCVDFLVPKASKLGKKSKCPGEHDILIVCEEKRNQTVSSNLKTSHVLTYANIIFLVVAMVFLLLTVLGFALLEKPNIHKQTMLFYVMSQFLFYSFLFIIYLDDMGKFIYAKSWCMPVAVLAHFFGLSTFSWLTVINYDLWWTFRVLQPQIDTKWTRLAWYTLVATLIPASIVTISLLLHAWDWDKSLDGEYCRQDVISRQLPLLTYPGYGKDHCFLSGSVLYYFYAPMGVLLVANVVFYSCTSYRLCSFYKKSQRSIVKKHRKSCQLLLKLFFVMGIVWILQVVHALVEPEPVERTWVWGIVDILSLLQSVAIFVIFICKKENGRAIIKKFPLLRGKLCMGGLESFPDNTPDGSTRLSRTESQRKTGVPPEFQQPSEIIQLPYSSRNG